MASFFFKKEIWYILGSIFTFYYDFPPFSSLVLIQSHQRKRPRTKHRTQQHRRLTCTGSRHTGGVCRGLLMVGVVLTAPTLGGGWRHAWWTPHIRSVGWAPFWGGEAGLQLNPNKKKTAAPLLSYPRYHTRYQGTRCFSRVGKWSIRWELFLDSFRCTPVLGHGIQRVSALCRESGDFCSTNGVLIEKNISAYTYSTAYANGMGTPTLYQLAAPNHFFCTAILAAVWEHTPSTFRTKPHFFF